MTTRVVFGAVGSLATGVLGTITVTAIPVLSGEGKRADNPTLLDRDYRSGFLLVAVLVIAGVLVRQVVVNHAVSPGIRRRSGHKGPMTR